METVLAFTTTAVVSLLAPHFRYARDLILPIGGRVNQNAADYYTGYRGADFDVPWAKYFNESMMAPSQEFIDGLERSPVSPKLGTAFKDAGKALNEPGYLPLENGYTILDDGSLHLAIRADVPSSFTGEMFDFWFSWHANDTTKYKLWHPGQHQYAALSEKNVHRQQSKTTYRERYWNMTSFVDEYIGDAAKKLSISFFDPSLLGFSVENPATEVQTIVTAFVQLSAYTHQDPASMAAQGFGPLNIVLAHQVRRRPDGKGNEIRSRFWFGWLLTSGMKIVVPPYQLARELSLHCASEMTHLGTFLPALFEEFRDDVAT